MRNAVYIAGPMSGYENFNKDSFFQAEKYLRSMGFEIIGNPAAWDIAEYGADILVNKTGDVAESAAKGFDLRSTMAKDLAFVCKVATHIFMLKGWEHSKGARAEHAAATSVGVEVIYQ